MERSVLFVTNSFPKSCPSSQTCFIVPKNWINIATSLCIPKYLCKCSSSSRAPLLSSSHATIRPGPISHSYKYFVRNAICHKISKKDLNRLISWLRLSEQQMNETDKCGRRTENGIGESASASEYGEFECECEWEKRKIDLPSSGELRCSAFIQIFHWFYCLPTSFSFAFCVGGVFVRVLRSVRTCKEISKRANKREADGSNLQLRTRNHLCGKSKKFV